MVIPPHVYTMNTPRPRPTPRQPNKPTTHQVIRCFENDDIIHVSGSVDPVRDMEIINLELALSDLSQVEKRVQRVRACVSWVGVRALCACVYLTG